MTLSYRRDDSLAPNHAPGARVYAVTDAAGRLRGVVAGSGRLWVAGRPGPLRSKPWLPVAQAETREAAARAMVEGRP